MYLFKKSENIRILLDCCCCFCCHGNDVYNDNVDDAES